MRSLVGTRALTRLALRRDRVRLPVWVGSLALVVVVFGATIGDLYPTVQSRVALGTTVAANPSLVGLLGPLFDPTSVGGLVAWRMSLLPMVLVPLMALLAVVRHTRVEEETGRLDLIGSTVVGRRAPLAAALFVATGASLLLGALVTLGMIGLGEPAPGAVVLGLSYAAAGWTFAAVAAVTAQLTESARAASGLAGAVLGVSYLLRAVGDSVDGLGWLTWASPVSWPLQTRPFAGERWWVLGVALACVVVLVRLADVLVARRDMGAGLLPTRRGPADAPAWLRNPFAHAWRLQRATLLAWTGGMFVIGGVYGSLTQGIGDLLESSPQIAEVFELVGGEQRLVDAFLATTLGIIGVITAIYTIQATLRLRTEETGMRAEPILATAVGRVPWALGHLAVAAGGTVVVLVAAGLGEGLAHGLRTGAVASEVPRLVGGALVQAPAVWVLAGLTLALFGLAPRATGAAWGALVAFLLLGQLGPLLQVDQWVMDLSPFTHVPKVPGGELTAVPLLWLGAVAAGLVAAGLAGFRRRDLD